MKETKIHETFDSEKSRNIYIFGQSTHTKLFFRLDTHANKITMSNENFMNIFFRTYVVQDGCRGIAPEGVADALKKMIANGISIIKSEKLTENPNSKIGSRNSAHNCFVINKIFFLTIVLSFNMYF